MTILTTLGVLLCTSAPSFAQTWLSNAPGDVDLELMQIFRVETDGPRARAEGMTGDPGFISEVGTAFAVAPNALITAKHVPHEAREFRNTSQSSVVWIPDRIVELSFAEERLADPDIDDTQRVTITPSPFPTIDASRINLNRLQAKPFPLSMCPITPGDTYYLVKLRNGDLGLPVVVPITADINEHSGAGDLRLFTHNLTAGSRDTPKGGDSGSPILDEDGQVVGLLTAILDGTPELYVTLTRDWVDLVPPEVRVACDTSVTTRDLEALEAQMTAYIDDELAPLRAETARLAELTGDLVAADEAINDRIGANETSIGENDTLISGHTADITSLQTDIEAVRKRTTATVQAMMDQVEDGEFADALFAEVFEKLRSAEPVIPAVDRIRAELSQETWSFDYSIFEDNSDSHLIDVIYGREITAPPFADNLSFCYKAMLPPAPGVDIDLLAGFENVQAAGFYRFAEKNPGQNMDVCIDKPHQARGRDGVYGFSMQLNVRAYRDVEDWNGMVYAFVYDPSVTMEVNGEPRPEILHRMVFVSDPTNPSAPLECYYYGFKKALARVTDDLATIAKTPIEQLNGFETCPK